MKRSLSHIVAAAGILAALSCTRELSPSGEDLALQLPLTLSVSGASPATKMTDQVVQSGAYSSSFRGMDYVLVFPFATGGTTVSGTDPVWGHVLQLPSFGTLVEGSQSRLFNATFLNLRTSNMLCYGKALDRLIPIVPDSLAFKRGNGVLRHPEPLTVKQASDLGFSPEPFLNAWGQSAAFTTWRNNLISKYLNGVVKSEVKNTRVSPNVYYRFRIAEEYGHHPGLEAALSAFVNEGAMMPASAEILDAKLTELYRAVYPYAQDRHASEDYHVGTYYYVYELAIQILKQINNKSYVTVTGTGTAATVRLIHRGTTAFGLPAGAYGIQYREGSREFNVSLDNGNNGTDRRVGMYTADAGIYVYPPSLFYRTNSPIGATDNEKVTQYYTASSGSWSNIIGHYPDPMVVSTSRAAAIREPLQYGVSRLQLKMKKTASAQLEDHRGNVAVDNGHFPLTGVLVSGQRPVDFEFHPVTGNFTGSYIVYDADVYDGNTPRMYISSSYDSADVSLLLLESQEGEDVTFAVEFLNASDETLHGENDCLILPGMHFYLLGRLKLSSATDHTGGQLSRVFTQDRVSTVSLSAPDLKHAYTVLPDLRQVQLSIGVDAQMDWYYTPPSVIEIK